jgi:hypothetical protein
VPVSIQIKPDAFVEPRVGGWTASGAANDLGRYMRTPSGSNPCFCTTQPEGFEEDFEEDFVLTNNQGTGTLTIKAQETVTPQPEYTPSPGVYPEPSTTTGVWVITSATGTYYGSREAGLTSSWAAR